MIKFINLSTEAPYSHFQTLYKKALDQNQKGVEVISISSFDKNNNEVEARYVNLKYIQENEWIFFSNYLSPKAQQFESHDQISVLIYWEQINIQIRMKAKIYKTSDQFSDEHFQVRAKEKNALAISSNQSQSIESFEEVAKKFNSTLDAMTEETKRPQSWGGFSFVPYYFEFWQGHENNLNERHFFKQRGGKWQEGLIQP